ncbi:unnamed protein product, partial [Ectocarpus sp. 13 AM-2016]
SSPCPGPGGGGRPPARCSRALPGPCGSRSTSGSIRRLPGRRRSRSCCRPRFVQPCLHPQRRFLVESPLPPSPAPERSSTRSQTGSPWLRLAPPGAASCRRPRATAG